MALHTLMSHAGHPLKVNDNFQALTFSSDASSFLETALGNVPGRSMLSVAGFNPLVGTSYEDIWGEGGEYVYPTSAETLEIVSSSADDAAAGTGGRTVVLISLDANFDEQQTTVPLNGVTPVVLTGTHIRTRLLSLVTAGSLLKNVGTLTLRVSGGGNTRLIIEPEIGNSKSSYFTVPNGKVALPQHLFAFAPKDEDITIRGKFRSPEADSPFIIGAEFPIYQADRNLPVLSPPILDQKTDTFFQATSSVNIDVRVTMFMEYIIIDRESIPPVPDILRTF